jgi:hypothetical protein
MSGFRVAVAAIAAAMLIAGAVAPASADEHGDRRGRNDHHERHDRRPPPRPAWGYDQPSYVEAPPPMVYAPPQEPAFLNFGITLR